MTLRCLVCRRQDLKNEKGPCGPSSYIYIEFVEVTTAFVDAVKTRIARFVFQDA
jgi:hypothetical protein